MLRFWGKKSLIAVHESSQKMHQNRKVRFDQGCGFWGQTRIYPWPAVRSVTLNLANKFSQCTFSVAEYYDLDYLAA